MTQPVRVFQVTTVDYVAARSSEEALKFYNQFCAGATEFDLVELVPPEVMATRLYNEQGAPPSGMTFQQKLDEFLAADVKPPFLFLLED